ncbi:MAG: flagellum-specific ATP synthase FliI, partial [Nitrospirota bacterium]
ISRVMPHVIDKRHREYAGRFIEVLSTYRKFEDMINLGAYKQGSNFKVDYALKIIERLRSYLRQEMNDLVDYTDSIQGLYSIFDEMEKQDA